LDTAVQSAKTHNFFEMVEKATSENKDGLNLVAWAALPPEFVKNSTSTAIPAGNGCINF